MFIIDMTNPLILLLLTIGTVLLIFLGKEIKKPLAPAIALVFFLILILFHTAQLTNVLPGNYQAYHSTLLGCITIDLIMIYISFFAYLWIDDIACKFYKKKSIDNSLDWFWKEV